MNPNVDIVGGAGEEVVDILENIPSDSERISASDAGEMVVVCLIVTDMFPCGLTQIKFQQNDNEASVCEDQRRSTFLDPDKGIMKAQLQKK